MDYETVNSAKSPQRPDVVQQEGANGYTKMGCI